MFFISIIFLTVLIPSIESVKPSLKLTFIPNEQYYQNNHQVDIICEILNPAENMEPPQLWHADLQNGKHTQVSRSLIVNPTATDTPDIFKQNTNKRIEFVKKNHIRIRNLQLEDSAQYECNCPDCEQALDVQKKLLQVMKLVKPTLHIEPGWKIQEKAKTKLRCSVDNFYPYVSFKVIRNHHEITNQGRESVPKSLGFPQKFSWEADLEPEDNWHNTKLECIVTQGNNEQHTEKTFEILFTPRFLKCDEKQYVNSTQENASIECTYSGNPAPTLTWFLQSDEKALKSDTGITMETKDEYHGKYKSIVTFNREKLINIPLTTTLSTTTKLVTGKPDTTAKPKPIGDNYYQQLLTDGFIVKLTINNEEKGVKKISIVSDASEVRSNALDNSSIKAIQSLSTTTILLILVSLTIRLMIQRH